MAARKRAHQRGWTERVSTSSPCGHGEHPVGPCRRATASWVMSTTAVPLLARELEHQLDHHCAGFLVEIAGRLVGEEQPGFRRVMSARQPDALLFAARQRRRAMMQPACRARPPRALAAAASHASAPATGRARRSRARGRHCRARSATGSGESSGTRYREYGGGTPPDRPRSAPRWSCHRPPPPCLRGGALEPGQQHQQRGLAAARRADDRSDFRSLDAEIETFLRM
jgi:hypothetical protein